MSKTIVITGGSSGIGETCARFAVEAGHKVVVAARSKNKLDRLVSELGPENAMAVRCDVTEPEDQRTLFETTIDQYGKIDVVFANAGLGASARGTESGDVESFRDMIMVNNFAVTVTAKYAIPHLKASGGHMVLTGSLAGHKTVFGSVYSATKWFVRGYADNLAAELAGTGARVTCLNPGMVNTPFFDDPKPHALKPEDVARAFMYVIDQPSHVLIPSMLIYPRPTKSFYDPNH